MSRSKLITLTNYHLLYIIISQLNLLIINYKRRKDMFFKIDQWLIKQFEIISNEFCRLTGKTNFFLARLFIVLATATGVLMLAHSILYFFIPIILIFFIVYMASAYVAEYHAKVRLEQGLANPNKITGYSDRALNAGILSIIILLVLSSSPITIHDVCNILFVLFYLIADYLMACDVKPPTKSLVRQLMDALAPKPVLVPIPIKK